MTARGPLPSASGIPAAPAHANRDTARRVVPLFRPYRAQVAAVVALIVVTSTIGIINPLLIQAVFNKALFVPGGPAPRRTLSGTLASTLTPGQLVALVGPSGGRQDHH